MHHGHDAVREGQDDVARLVAILTRVAGPDRTPDRVGPETLINEGGFWLDSADLLEVVLACEDAFSVNLDPATVFADGSALTVTGIMDAIHRAPRR